MELIMRRVYLHKIIKPQMHKTTNIYLCVSTNIQTHKQIHKQINIYTNTQINKRMNKQTNE
nr:MAG TPA: hypothetical protein [Caudoviricetes sp.]